MVCLSACAKNKPDADDPDVDMPAEVTREWEQVGAGMEMAIFEMPKKGLVGDSLLTVLRIDPLILEPRILTAAGEGHAKLTADAWAARYQLAMVTNAGMFDVADHSTHVGYLKTSKGANQAEVHPEYFSVFAFDPIDEDSVPARMFDTDETDFESEIEPKFRGVMQNLRLIKRPGENRWTQQPKQWSEAALGEDGAGRMLLIFCRTPYSMHDFNNYLLGLRELDLVCAHHLEGGPEASLFVDYNGTRISLVGSYETGFNENDDNHEFWPIPNVLTFTRTVPVAE